MPNTERPVRVSRSLAERFFILSCAAVPVSVILLAFQQQLNIAELALTKTCIVTPFVGAAIGYFWWLGSRSHQNNQK